jgi:hypothetical protein
VRQQETLTFTMAILRRMAAKAYFAGLLLAIVLHQHPNALFTARWALVQWIPQSKWSQKVQQTAWEQWERQNQVVDTNTTTATNTRQLQLEINDVDVQAHHRPGTRQLLEYLETTYGSDWRRRPLLLRNLWSVSDLQHNVARPRKLSLEGLLKEDLIVPYFSDARLKGALAPDRTGRIRDIIRNMTDDGAFHKIGTQHLLQTYPDLIREVAPSEVVTLLFGNHFEPHMLGGWGPWKLLPATTTVPLFVAGTRASTRNQNYARKPQKNTPNLRDDVGAVEDGNTEYDSESNLAFTGLHCEPIGNVAVQLSGQKQWMLVSPEHSHLIRPALAPDGRAFFASHATAKDLAAAAVPMYSAETKAGDAIWVPTWTWHRVDYVMSTDEISSTKLSRMANKKRHDNDADTAHIAIGGSLFHFRPVDFVVNHPLFAALIVPALFLELIGYKTQ